MTSNPTFYNDLLNDIRNRIRHSQIRAAVSANEEMIRMYWDIGRMIHQRQQMEGWGAGIIPKLARDIRNELPQIKGFSQRNIGYMVRFFREYGEPSILQQAVAKLPGPSLKDETPLLPEEKILPKRDHLNLQWHVAKIPWGHNILLMERVKDPGTRLWYIKQTIEQGWGRETLAEMIRKKAYERHGQAVSNFSTRLPAPQSELAGRMLKDPYLFDFLTLEEPFHERELETGLIRHLENFLLELGSGFAFVGRQYHLVVSDRDFYLDLLFYHLKLRCFIVIELKKGDFKPEYAGKMNFYCSVVDDQLRIDTDQSTIGLILCQTKDRILAEYTLRDIHKPIGISDYELTRSLPGNLQSSLPTVEEIEMELSQEIREPGFSENDNSFETAKTDEPSDSKKPHP